jgi:hypothetical protein
VTDNRPDRMMVYKVIERGHVLMTGEEAAAHFMRPVKLPPFRHLAYTSVKEDADAMALTMNDAENARIDLGAIRARVS